MSQILTPSQEFVKQANVNMQKYHDWYRKSVEHTDEFWAEQAERITWTRKWHKVKEVSFVSPVSIKWFLGGKLNVIRSSIQKF